MNFRKIESLRLERNRIIRQRKISESKFLSNSLISNYTQLTKHYELKRSEHEALINERKMRNQRMKKNLKTQRLNLSSGFELSNRKRIFFSQFKNEIEKITIQKERNELEKLNRTINELKSASKDPLRSSITSVHQLPSNELEKIQFEKEQKMHILKTMMEMEKRKREDEVKQQVQTSNIMSEIVNMGGLDSKVADIPKTNENRTNIQNNTYNDLLDSLGKLNSSTTIIKQRYPGNEDTFESSVEKRDPQNRHEKSPVDKFEVKTQKPKTPITKTLLIPDSPVSQKSDEVIIENSQITSNPIIPKIKSGSIKQEDKAEKPQQQVSEKTQMQNNPINPSPKNNKAPEKQHEKDQIENPTKIKLSVSSPNNEEVKKIVDDEEMLKVVKRERRNSQPTESPVKSRVSNFLKRKRTSRTYSSPKVLKHNQSHGNVFKKQKSKSLLKSSKSTSRSRIVDLEKEKEHEEEFRNIVSNMHKVDFLESFTALIDSIDKEINVTFKKMKLFTKKNRKQKMTNAFLLEFLTPYEQKIIVLQKMINAEKCDEIPLFDRIEALMSMLKFKTFPLLTTELSNKLGQENINIVMVKLKKLVFSTEYKIWLSILRVLHVYKRNSSSKNFNKVITFICQMLIDSEKGDDSILKNLNKFLIVTMNQPEIEVTNEISRLKRTYSRNTSSFTTSESSYNPDNSLYDSPSKQLKRKNSSRDEKKLFERASKTLKPTLSMEKLSKKLSRKKSNIILSSESTINKFGSRKKSNLYQKIQKKTTTTTSTTSNLQKMTHKKETEIKTTKPIDKKEMNGPIESPKSPQKILKKKELKKPPKKESESESNVRFSTDSIGMKISNVERITNLIKPVNFDDDEDEDDDDEDMLGGTGVGGGFFSNLISKTQGDDDDDDTGGDSDIFNF